MTSKIGVHFQGPPEIGTEATELVRATPSMVVKGIDPDHWHAAPHEIFPNNRVVSRLWIGGDAQDAWYMGRGADGARDYFAMLRYRYDQLIDGGALDILGPNEPHPNIENAAAYEDFEREWVNLTAQIGMRPWAWSFGVGWPGLKIAGNNVTAGHFTDSIAEACAAGGGLDVHEYGAPEVLSGDGWWTLRYKHTLAELWDAGLPQNDTRVLIGECGIDRGVMGGFGGWQTFREWVYEPQCGLSQGGMNEDRYFCQMSAYDDILLEDPYVMAATPFVTCPAQQWSTFDWSGRLIAMAKEKHDAIDPPIDPPIEPPPCGCEGMQEQIDIIGAQTAALTEIVGAQDARIADLERGMAEMNEWRSNLCKALQAVCQ